LTKKKSGTVTLPPFITAYDKSFVKKLEKQMKSHINKNSKSKKKILPTLFPIGKRRRQLAMQYSMMNQNSQYSDALLENWKPQQTIHPVSRNGNPLSANTIFNRVNQQMTLNYFSNPHQDLDYIIFEDIFNYTVAGPVLRELVKFIMGRGFKPKIKSKFEIDPTEELKLQKKHKDVLDNLNAIDANIGRSTERGIDISFQEKMTKIILNTFVFNRDCGIYGYGPVNVNGTEFNNIPNSLKVPHPRDIGIIQFNNDDWTISGVQIKQAVNESSNGIIPVKDLFYLWNSMLSSPTYQSDGYGVSMIQNMMDECRTLRRLIGINFPTYADAMHTGIPIITMTPEGSTDSDRIKEGNDIADNWVDGTPNLLFKNPKDVNISNIPFDPKIKEFSDLSELLTRYVVMKGGLPQSLFFAENDANMATLRYRIQLAISVNINPIRAWIERAISDQHYMRIFKKIYGNSQEFKDITIGVQFEDLQIETMDDRINSAVEINDNLARLTPEGIGQILQDPSFVSKIDTTQEPPSQKNTMNIKNKSTGETFKVKSSPENASSEVTAISALRK